MDLPIVSTERMCRIAHIMRVRCAKRDEERPMRVKSLILAGVSALCLALPASAQELVTGASVDEILNLARGHGSATLETQANGDPQISGKMEGIAYRIYFMNCSDGADCEDLTLYSGFQDNHAGLESMHEWNVSNRFSKAFIDDDDDAAIEWDINLEHGVSRDNFDANLAVWSQVLKAFAEHIEY